MSLPTNACNAVLCPYKRLILSFRELMLKKSQYLIEK